MPGPTGQTSLPTPSLTRQVTGMPTPTGQADVHRARQGQADTRLPGSAQTDAFSGATTGPSRGLVTVPSTPPSPAPTTPTFADPAGGAGRAPDASSTRSELTPNLHTLNVLYHMGYKHSDGGLDNVGRASSNKKTADDIIVRLRQADTAGELQAVFAQLQDLGKLNEVQTLFDQSYNSVAQDTFEDYLDTSGFLKTVEPADIDDPVDVEVGTAPAGSSNRLPDESYAFLGGGTPAAMIFKMILGELGYKQSGRVLEYVGRASSDDKIADRISVRLGHAVRPATLKTVVDHLRMTEKLEVLVAVVAHSPSSTDMDNLMARLRSPDASIVKWEEDNNHVSHSVALAACAYTKIGDENVAALKAALEKVGLGHLI